MAGGPILPSSIYLGGASGNLSSTFYIPATNTVTNQGALGGIGVVLSLASIASAILQFNLPESLPTGTAKLRLLAMANATSGAAPWVTQDGVTSAGSSVGTTTLNIGSSQSVTWSTADILVETKQNIVSSLTANQILTVIINFAAQNTAGSVASASWTLAQNSVWQPSIVWE